MEQTISAKELRDHMKEVKNRLLKGETFVWIYHSQPIANIVPRLKTAQTPKWDMKKLEKIRKMMKHKKRFSAADWIRKERD